MTYGGEDQWIRLGLREYPRTNRLILIASSVKTGPDAGTGVSKDVKNEAEVDYTRLAKGLLDKFKEEEKGLPEKIRSKYLLLSPPDTRNHYELIRFFRELFFHIVQNNERIIINTTSGLQVWKLALYQVAMEFKEHIEDFYLIVKTSGEKRSIRIYRELKKYERDIIQIISEKPDISMGEVQRTYHKRNKKGNLTFISRTVKNLIHDELVKETKSGREVRLQLTSDGRSFIRTREYDSIISPLFKEI